jgi:hypothetical protein
VSNILTRNPIFCDTAFSSYKASVASVLGTLFTLKVFSVRWVGPATVGDQLELVDPQSGNQLLLMNCEVAGQDLVADWSAAPRLWSDFGLAKITTS